MRACANILIIVKTILIKEKRKGIPHINAFRSLRNFTKANIEILFNNIYFIKVTRTKIKRSTFELENALKYSKIIRLKET